MTGQRRMIPADAKLAPIPREKLATMRGIDLFRAMLAGELPGAPIAGVMNFTLTAAEEGMAEFRGIPLLEHRNPAGSIHGGWAATVLDSALGCAVHTMLPAGMVYATIEFKVNLVRPILDTTGEIICRGTVVHIGRTTAVSEATLKTVDGKLLAMGTETCAIFPIGG
jgi:uncharacterized protein (TIGR00369 family)